jgi:hypothetical protein
LSSAKQLGVKSENEVVTHASDQFTGQTWIKGAIGARTSAFGHLLAVSRQRPGVAATDAAHAIVGKLRCAEPVVLEVELDRVLALSQRGPLPPRPLDILSL